MRRRIDDRNRKGDLGERLVGDYLRRRGAIMYRPEHTGAHPFDTLCVTRDKQTIFAAEVKTKRSRTTYPDTGFNLRHYRDYQRVQEAHNLRVYVFFVDERKREIYGNWLDVMDQPRKIRVGYRDLIYPIVQKEIIFFPLESMRTVCSIAEDDAQALTRLTHNKFDQVHAPR